MRTHMRTPHSHSHALTPHTRRRHGLLLFPFLHSSLSHSSPRFRTPLLIFPPFLISVPYPNSSPFLTTSFLSPTPLLTFPPYPSFLPHSLPSLPYLIPRRRLPSLIPPLHEARRRPALGRYHSDLHTKPCPKPSQDTRPPASHFPRGSCGRVSGSLVSGEKEPEEKEPEKKDPEEKESWMHIRKRTADAKGYLHITPNNR